MSETTDIATWIREMIEGPAGMNECEHREWVIWHVSERVAAASWIVRCLANPKNAGSGEVLKAIIARRGGMLRCGVCGCLMAREQLRFCPRCDLPLCGAYCEERHKC